MPELNCNTPILQYGAKADLELNANRCFQAHRQAFSQWKFGQIEETWIDMDGNLCIRYEKEWWHYKEVNGSIIWW